MPKITESYKADLLERLKKPEEATAYINAALEEGDSAVFLLALRDIAEARGIKSVATQTGLNRENLYRTLSAHGNPRLSSLFSLLAVSGLHLAVQAPSKPLQQEGEFQIMWVSWEDSPSQRFCRTLPPFGENEISPIELSETKSKEEVKISDEALYTTA